MNHLLTEPWIVGVVGWLGLLVSVVGLSIAIYQILAVKRAALAARDAARDTSAVLHSRERLLDLSAALRHVSDARNHIGHRDYSKAVIFVELARQECLQVSELIQVEGDQKKRLYKLGIRLTKLAEALSRDEADEQEDETAFERGIEARAISDEINAVLARLRYRFEAEGIAK